MTFNFAIFIAGLSFAIITSANSGLESVAVTAYGRKADLTALVELVNVKNLPLLVKKMQNYNVSIYQVPIDSASAANQNFTFLNQVPAEKFPELAFKLSEVDSGSALFTTKDEIKNATANVILIASDAEPMTLLHEFAHHLFENQNHEDTAAITELEKDNYSFLRRFNFKTSKVMLDNSLLLSKLWRDEIKELAEEYANSVESKQGRSASEEIAIESTLIKILAQEKSHFLNLERARGGIVRYGIGLTVVSESLVRNIFALNDLIVTEGLNQDTSTTEEEKTDWQTRRAKIELKLNQYLDGPLARMRAQIYAAKDYLELLEKQKKESP